MRSMLLPYASAKQQARLRKPSAHTHICHKPLQRPYLRILGYRETLEELMQARAAALGELVNRCDRFLS